MSFCEKKNWWSSNLSLEWELLRKNRELDNTTRNLHASKCERELHSDEAQYRINEQESQIESYNTEIHKLINSNNEKVEKLILWKFE